MPINKPESVIAEYALSLYAVIIEPELPELIIDAFDAVAIKPEFELFFVNAILKLESVCIIAIVSFSFTVEQQ